jgi:hypothetical protein
MTFSIKTFAATVAVAILSVSGAANAASLVTFGNPWGQKSASIDGAMNAAFGAGNWNDITAPVGATSLTGDSFLYFEGGASTTNAMEAFLDANSAELLTFLTNGGHIFVNAAPNQGNGLSFGGLTLNYRDGYCRSGCDAVDPAHEIFTKAGKSFGGNSFSHGTVSNGTALIKDSGTGKALLAELSVGAGMLFMGSMTTTNFHRNGDPAALRANILTYAANGAALAQTPQVPLPAALPLLAAGLGGLSLLRARRKAA